MLKAQAEMVTQERAGWAAQTQQLPIVVPRRQPEPPRQIAPLMTRAQRHRADRAFGRW